MQDLKGNCFRLEIPKRLLILSFYVLIFKKMQNPHRMMSQILMVIALLGLLSRYHKICLHEMYLVCTNVT